MENTKLDRPAEHALSNLQDTMLSPMEEALFHSWAAANQIKKPDNADDPTDYRGIYKVAGGKILPYGELKQIATRVKSEKTLEQALQDRMLASQETAQDREDQIRKEKHQDKTHQQKLEMQRMELKKKPHELKSQELSLEQQQLANEGKKLDITKTLVTPKEKPNAGPAK